MDALLEAAGQRPDLFALVAGKGPQLDPWLAQRAIQTSFIQRLPWGASHVQQYLPLLPLAIEQFDLSAYPLVLSSSHLVAKGVLTGPDQLHLSYVHTPVRYAWDQMGAYLRHSTLARGPLGPLVRWQLHWLRQWDVASAGRPDVLVANSRFTASRGATLPLGPMPRRCVLEPLPACAQQAGGSGGGSLQSHRPAFGRPRRWPRTAPTSGHGRPPDSLPGAL